MPADEIRSRRYLRQIIADEVGLRWQEKWREEWQTATWDEVTDFYLELPDFRRFASATQIIIHFRDGRTLTFSAFWSNYQPLSKWIAEHSVNAEAARLPDGTIWWATKGTRPADLPVSFTYSEDFIRKARAESNRIIRIGFALLLSVFTFCGVGLFTFVGDFQLVPVIVILMAPVIALRIGIAISRRPKAKQVRDAERRAQQNERFEVTRETLTICQEGEKQVIPWTDIVGYDQLFVAAMLYSETVRIRAVMGKEFSFTFLMEGAERFAEMLPLYAPNAVVYRRGKNEKEALGGEKARWTGGEEGKGEKVFHRRTRPNRNNVTSQWLALVFLVGMAVMLGLPSLLIAYLSSPSNTFDLLLAHPFSTAFLLLFLIFLLPGLREIFRETRSYLRDRVAVGKEGIRVVKAGKEQALRWDGITNFRADTNQVSLEGMDGMTLKFTLSDYAYGSELPDLIAEHIERAKAEAERAAISSEDVTEPRQEEWVSSQDTSEKEQQKVTRKP